MKRTDYPEPAEREPDLVLLGCGKTKVPGTDPVPAADLYIGPLFQARRKFAEQQARPWLILSAKHGVVEPGCLLQPYDTTIEDLSPAALAMWQAGVRARLSAWFAGATAGRTLELHAGESYTRALRTALTGLRLAVVPAFTRQGIGVQLACYAAGYERPHTAGGFGYVELSKFTQP